MDWDKLRVFHAVAEAGSFTHAGERLNLSQSAVSRQISSLEESLDVPLFHRHARGLILTEQGELLLKTAQSVLDQLARAEILLTESKEKVRGPLKVTTTVGLGSIWLTPRIRKFLDLYPEVELSLLIDDSELDLGMREADIAIRVTTPRQPDLVQRHLMAIRFHIYASREYLQRRGTPQTLGDLDKHDLVIYGTASKPPIPNINWIMTVGDPTPGSRRAALRVNNQYAILQAVCSGLGLAALPDYIVQDSDNLVVVLPDVQGPTADAYFVYAEELRHSKRVAAFRDFLLQEVAGTKF
ncbi:MAG: LysR family transcriptional regulator [Rhodospirillaceae bacterium]|nr:LysR family transcriptional regulator [Rhodospirillaceae bacterium]